MHREILVPPPRWVGLSLEYVVSLVLLVGCAEDVLKPTGELTPSVPPPSAGIPAAIVAGPFGAGPVRLGGRPEPVSVRVVDSRGVGVSGVPVFWRVLAGGGTVHPDQPSTGAYGIATAGWGLGLQVNQSQVVEVSAPNLSPLLLYAQATLSDSLVIGTDQTAGMDTVGAILPDLVHLSVLFPDGRPVIGARIDFSVVEGDGTVTPGFALTDSAGQAGAEWQLGMSAGLHRVSAAVAGTGSAAQLRLRANNGAAWVDSLGGPLRVEYQATALPGNPTSLRIAPDTIVLDALGATAVATLEAFDRAGNPADPSEASWKSQDPQRVQVSPEGVLLAAGDGSTSVVARIGDASDTVEAVVSRVPVRFRLAVPTDTVNRLGDTLSVRAIAVDRLGSDIPFVAPTWRNLTPLRAELLAPGTVVPTAPGRVRLEASTGPVVDTARFYVRQVVASLVASRPSDTLALDSLVPLPFEARDSNGYLIPSSRLSVTAAEPAIVTPDTARLVARLPGTTTVTASADGVSAQADVTVEGVAILVGGGRLTTAGSLPRSLQRIEITNGRIRIVWDPPQLSEAGGFELDVRDGPVWRPGNARHVGDWLYVAYSVMTLPTDIQVVESNMDRIGLRMQFDNHVFAPPGYPAPADWVTQPYPFARTVWLGKGDNGYYSWIDLQADLGRLDVEHENGFGGVFGPATIRTSRLTLRTDTLEHIVVYNGDPRTVDLAGARTDAAEFIRDGDPVRRVLVPLPGAPFITPVFPDRGFGSVYVYRGSPRSFGVYMYADMADSGPPARSVCASAWAHAPFALPSVSAAELAECGPAEP
jgi:hypothetical protein